ncbi:MAG: RidA family protein [candidate division Zixibacteria bacterium]|nr:RidA family protein [candidate division Zixibacteria bacterium]
MKKAVYSELAPKPIGPYSQGIIFGNLVFCSGQIPIDLVTGELETGPIEKQAHLAFKNLATVLEAGGSGLDKAIKVTVFFKDLADFNRVNDIYAEYFKGVLPARAAIEVARLPKDALIEVDAIGYI